MSILKQVHSQKPNESSRLIVVGGIGIFKFTENVANSEKHQLAAFLSLPYCHK